MDIDEFDFELPQELIALRPARPRPASRLLVAQGEGIVDSIVSDLLTYLTPGDLLVLNDTKVIPGRLRGKRRRPGVDEASVEVTLIAAEPDGTWRTLARPGKRLAAGDVIAFGHGLTARVIRKEGAELVLELSQSGNALLETLEEEGEMPLPPYIAGKRPVDRTDNADYQTVFARRPGAVAAPTASLHFDQGLLDALKESGVQFAHVTLHVGAGTFLPVKVQDIERHKMHSEWGSIDDSTAEAIDRAMREGRRVIPVGTTALRVLETAATGYKQIQSWQGETDIFIKPGYQFRIADGLMTNFHLPKSTLLMLVSALMGIERMRRIYAHAIEHRYRFFSYGDSSLLIP